jgi:CheY-like chemotaxis protein
MTQGETVHVLLVEDDDIDAQALTRSFRKQRIANPIHVAVDGLEALSMLRGDGRERIPRPYVILLDLNMPRMDGIEFLEELRSDPELKASVVFVLTTSDSDRDIVSAYENQVAGYMVKGRVGDDFMQVIGMLDHYWRVIELPRERSS